jgi:hypothetical protein
MPSSRRRYGPSRRDTRPRPPVWLLVGKDGQGVAWIDEATALEYALEGETVLGYLPGRRAII